MDLLFSDFFCVVCSRSSVSRGIFSAFLIADIIKVEGNFLCSKWYISSSSLCSLLCVSDTIVHILLAKLKGILFFMCLGWQVKMQVLECICWFMEYVCFYHCIFFVYKYVKERYFFHLFLE